MYHDFLSPPRRGSHVKSDHIHNHQTFSRESTSREVDSFIVGPFDSLSQPHHATHSVTYIPGLSSPSDLSESIRASTVFPLLPTATLILWTILTSVSLAPAIHLLPPSTPFWPYGTPPFFPHPQTITIFSALSYSLTPFLFQLSYASLNS